MDSFVLLFITLIVLLWFSLREYPSSPQIQSSDKHAKPASGTESLDNQHVELKQVYPPQGKKTENGIDIIAIHGFDARSPDTWIWKSKIGDVNWLADDPMLPERVRPNRIFTCDWPSKLFEHADYSQHTFTEFARVLLAGIEAELQGQACHKKEERPIFFIASCIGGIILMKALVLAGLDSYVKRNVRGIIFLATPFRGTSFQDVAALAQPGLRLWAILRNKQVSKLLNQTMSSKELGELVREFSGLCTAARIVDCMNVFYEKGKSSIPRKLFPWLPEFLSQWKPVVEEDSAILDIILHPLPLNRTHSQMNKFPGPDDGDYQLVVGEIVTILEKIRVGQPHEKADRHIMNYHYRTERLQIERISSEKVSVETCFVNLAIINYSAEQKDEPETNDESKTEAESETGHRSQPSPFSLDHRLNIKSPKDNMKIEIAHLFEERKYGKNGGLRPRRILIRGQAGVGKSTLCKKLVHDFKEHGIWKDLFDRILWIPLRNLKRLVDRDCNLAEMFNREYFSQMLDGEILAKQFWGHLQASRYERTLFILDGLDEVNEILEDGSPLVQSLLDMPALSVTSRPQVSLSNKKFDLELETIGFYPDQVDLYIDTVFPLSPENAENLRSVLQKHRILRGLVRIPIQLDALCYIWADRNSSLEVTSEMQNMTGIYQAIVKSLWVKDIPALKKKSDGSDIGKDQLRRLSLKYIERFVGHEVRFLEQLAFTGMASETITINFTGKYCLDIWEDLTHDNGPVLPHDFLQRTSFLRTSDPSSDMHHFLHLTFQEYFAARYFVRRWQENSLPSENDDSSESVESFVKHHKYDAKYDIFWRFVAGLLDLSHLERLFKVIGSDPLDLVGPVHQRLLLHCLSEVSLTATSQTLTTEMGTPEVTLAKWLACDTEASRLVSELEFPEAALNKVLESASSMDHRLALAESLKYRPLIPTDSIRTVCSWPSGDTDLTVAILEMLGRQQGTLDDKTLDMIVKHIEDESWQVHLEALAALQNFPELEDRILDTVTALVKNSRDTSQRSRAIEVLGSQSCLNRQFTDFLLKNLEKGNNIIRSICIGALGRQLENAPYLKDAPLPRDASLYRDKILRSITNRLKDTDRSVTSEAVRVLENQPRQSDEVFKTVDEVLRGRGEGFKRDEYVRFLEDWFKSDDQYKGAIYKLIRVQLNSEIDSVRRLVLKGLKKWSQLDVEILDIVTAQLKHDGDYGVRYQAIKTLGSHNRFDIVKAQLDDEDFFVRAKVITTLGSQPRLSQDILEAVKIRAQRGDEHGLVVEQAMKTLIIHSHGDHDTRNIIMNFYERYASKRSAVIRALRNWPQPDDELIGLVVAHLDESHLNGRDVSVKLDALRALGAWPRLSDIVLDTIARQLGSEHKKVQIAAAEALRNRPHPTDVVMKAIARQLRYQRYRRDSSSEVPRDWRDSFSERQEADEIQRIQRTLLKVLKGWPQLDDDVLCAVAELFGHDRGHIDVVGFFRSRPQPQIKVIDEIMRRLECEKESTRKYILQAFGNWTQLDNVTLSTIATHLRDPEFSSREAAFRVLTNQETPPFLVLETHVKSLYQISFRLSFRENVYWFIENERPCIVVGSKKIDWNQNMEEGDSTSSSGSSLGLQVREHAPEWLESLRSCNPES